MPRTFDPAALFERWRRDPKLVPYKTEAAALDAVARRAKAIWQTGFAIDELAAGSPAFVRLLRAAFERGLAVTFVHRPVPSLPWRDQVPDLYVLPLDQTWRLAAIEALWQTAAAEGGWSLAAEAQHGHLLGYTAAQRAAWRAATDAQQAGFGCLTAYALLDDAQRRATLALGKRALGPAADLVGRELFFPSYRALLRRDAHARVPAGLTLARVGLDWDAARAVFGAAQLRRDRGLGRATITRAHAQRVADGLRTGVQLLGPRGFA